MGAGHVTAGEASPLGEARVAKARSSEEARTGCDVDEELEDIAEAVVGLIGRLDAYLGAYRGNGIGLKGNRVNRNPCRYCLAYQQSLSWTSLGLGFTSSVSYPTTSKSLMRG